MNIDTNQIALFRIGEIIDKIISSGCVYNNPVDKVIDIQMLAQLCSNYIIDMSLSIENLNNVIVLKEPKFNWKKIYFNNYNLQYQNFAKYCDACEDIQKKASLPFLYTQFKHAEDIDVANYLSRQNKTTIHYFSDSKLISQLHSLQNVIHYKFDGTKHVDKKNINIIHLIVSGIKHLNIPSIFNSLDSVLYRKNNLFIKPEKISHLDTCEIKNWIKEEANEIRVFNDIENTTKYPYIYCKLNNYKERLIANQVLLRPKHNPRFVIKDISSGLKEVLAAFSDQSTFEQRYKKCKTCI